MRACHNIVIVFYSLHDATLQVFSNKSSSTNSLDFLHYSWFFFRGRLLLSLPHYIDRGKF